MIDILNYRMCLLMKNYMIYIFVYKPDYENITRFIQEIEKYTLFKNKTIKDELEGMEDFRICKISWNGWFSITSSALWEIEEDVEVVNVFSIIVKTMK